MENQIVIEKLTKLINEFLLEEHNDAYFLVGTDLSKGKLLRIYIDGVEPVSFQVCKQVSRKVEECLDETKWLGEDYKLEVSSPGAEKPLTDPRQFAKHIGRTVIVTELSENTINGKLLAVTKEKMSIATKNEKTIDLALEQIQNIKVEISFK